MMRVAFGLAALSILGAGPARGEPAPASAETGTGFTIGRTGGIGLHHRQFLPSGWGWGVGGISFYTGTAWYTNFGAQGYYTLDRTETQRLYAVGGASYTQDAAYGVGLGLGWSLGRQQGVALALELPLVFLYTPSTRIFTPAGALRDTTWSYDLYPIPNVSLVFNY